MSMGNERKRQFAEARNYAVYYGRGEADKLSGYDIAIVEPAGQDEQTILQMQKAGTLVFAYVSMVEMPDYDSLKDYLNPADYLSVNHQPVENAQFHTKLVDLRSRNWNSLLLHRVGGFIRNSGYDGLFMDTLSDLEWPSLPEGVRAEQQTAAVELIKRIRQLHPDRLLLQNNALESLCNATAPYIDGICWENPDLIRPETFHWHKNAKEKLKRLALEWNIRILLLQDDGAVSEQAIESAASLASKEHYLHSVSTNHYLSLPPG